MKKPRNKTRTAKKHTRDHGRDCEQVRLAIRPPPQAAGRASKGKSHRKSHPAPRERSSKERLTTSGYAAYTSRGNSGRGGILEQAYASLRALGQGISGTPAPNGRSRSRYATRALAISAPGDDRQTFALLTAPVLAMIVALGATEAIRPRYRVVEPPVAAVPASPVQAERSAIAPSPTTRTVLAAPLPTREQRDVDVLKLRSTIEAAPSSTAPQATVLTNTSHPAPSLIGTPPATMLPHGKNAQQIAISRKAEEIVTRTHLDQLPAGSKNEPALEVAALAPVLAPTLAAPASDAAHDDTPTHEIPLTGDASMADALGRAPDQCEAPPDLLLTAAQRANPRRLPPLPPRHEIGMAIAVAARSQASDLVIYDDRYRRIGYPMGDVSPLYGVCTDVVIRAYRSIGIDLQQLVQASGLGSGDPNIDHRRTETLRRFFARFGENLPATTVPEDYRPGDIVTYHRPQNTSSRSHIAIVSDVVAPSGRYMIIHNRGWGVQLEDGLFVDEITGHYRYDGGTQARTPLAAAELTAHLTSSELRKKRLADRSQARQSLVQPPTFRMDGEPVRGLGR